MTKYIASCSFGKDSHNTFRPNTTLIDLEERFKKEDEQNG